MSEQQRASHLKKVAETYLTKSLPDCDMQDGAGNQPLSIDVHDTGLSVPQGIVDGIWKKASELLSTPGAIGFAPGLAPQARTVISKTHSGFHTVVPGKGGRFSCDNCPNYKSLGICSHTVAVAEVNHVLPQFIACLNKGKGVRPNLTKLLTSDMPAGRGRKGNQAPRKRKTSVGVTNAVEVLPTLPGVSSSAAASMLPLITHSSPSATPWSSPLDLPSPFSLPPPTMQNVSAETYSGNVIANFCGTSATPPPLYSLPSSVCLPPPTLQSVSTQSYSGNMYNTTVIPALSHVHDVGARQQRNPPPPPLVRVTSPISPTSQTEANDSFSVVFLGNRVKKCYGCTQEFARKANGTLLDPPHDIVIRHADHREYYSGGEKKLTKQKQNTYFHPCISCVRSKCPNFAADQLDMSAVAGKLTSVHLSYLQNHFGLTL